MSPTWRDRWERTKRRLRRLSDLFPFTPAGTLLVGASVVALAHYGFGKIDLVLLGVGGVALCVAGLSLTLTVAATLLTWRQVRALPDRDRVQLECGYWVPSGFSLPSPWWLPLVSVSWRWAEPEAPVRLVHQRGRAHEEVFPVRRAQADRIVRRFDVGDIFGLCRLSLSAAQQGEVRMLPWIGALRQMHVLHGLAAGDDLSHPEGPAEGDRYDMRHYVAGDPIRFVLWKVFARSRDLVVRTPERAVSHTRKTAVYLVSDRRDEPAAGAARMAVDSGVFGGDWVLGADGCDAVARGKDRALDLLVRSSRASEAQAGAGLSGFFATAASGSLARAVVFVPPRPGPWLARVLKAAGSLGQARVQFIVGIDGVDTRAGRSRAARWAERREPDASEPLGIAAPTELAEVIKALGHNVLIVDRVRGHVFTAAQLRVTQAI